MKILNLYSGIGGNRKLWSDEHEITAVELNPDIAKVYQEFYPNDTVIVGDAHEYLLEHYKEFDFIWASPPCPSHSCTNHFLNAQGVIRYPDMKLYEEIIFVKHFFKGLFVIENVKSYYNPLIEPTTFGRHYFWTNFLIHPKDIKDPAIGMIGGGVGANELAETIGVDVSTFTGPKRLKRQIVRNCVLPELGKHILDCATGAEIKIEERDLFE